MDWRWQQGRAGPRHAGPRRGGGNHTGPGGAAAGGAPVVATLNGTRTTAAAQRAAPSRQVAVGVLTQSKGSARYAALLGTWLRLFLDVLVFESHTDVLQTSEIQQTWK